MTAVSLNFASVRQRIAEAACRMHRDPSTVRIIAVTKGFSPDAVRAALTAGVGDLGENYVQEARAKRLAVPDRAVWHLIGGLQRRKVRAAVATFDHVHSVDAAPLAGALAAAASCAGRRLPVLIQVNITGAMTKGGVSPEGLTALAQACLLHPKLVLEGLMTIAPAGASPEEARACFRTLRALRDDVAHRLGCELPHLSMGMSDDFEIAVEEGATWLRLGRALFGARPKRGVDGGGG